MTGQKKELSRRDYFLPVPLLLLSILPAGIVFFIFQPALLQIFGKSVLESTLSGAMWGSFVGGLIVGSRLILKWENFPLAGRIGAVLGLTGLGYAVAITVFLLNMTPAPDRGPDLPVIQIIPDSPIPKAEWKEFAPPEAGCAILMPGTPQAQKHDVPLPEGAVPMHLFQVERKKEGRTFFLAFNDYPPAVMNRGAQQILDGVVDGARQNWQGEYFSSKTIAQDGIPGRRVTLKSSRKGTWMARYFLVNNRLYQVVVMGPGVHDDSPVVTAFFDSFKPQDSKKK
jgi:hypothetical protein